ncbi:MAG: hypothetical protein FK734_04115 [Asgard group archaeon]|nr:hypothetical protein [Asgard group archaeon]
MTGYYPNTITKIIKDHKLKDGVLIQCFPGQGLVGRIAGMQLIEYFNANKAAKIYSTYFPQIVVFQGDLGKLIHAEIYSIEETKTPIIIVTGESQPQEGPEGMFHVLNAILDLAEKWGVNKVIAIGGFTPTQYESADKVTGFAYTNADIDTLHKNDIPIFKEGRVSGAVGVLTALASERGLQSFGLMGKVKLMEGPNAAFTVDPNAAKNVLEVVAKLLDIEMDLSKMDKMISEIEETEANAMKVLEEMNKTREGSDRKNYYI